MTLETNIYKRIYKVINSEAYKLNLAKTTKKNGVLLRVGFLLLVEENH